MVRRYAGCDWDHIRGHKLTGSGAAHTNQPRCPAPITPWVSSDGVFATHISGCDISSSIGIGIGTTVTWRTASGIASGRVTGIHPRPVVRRVNGVRIARLGSPEDPAYEIEQPDGGHVLRLLSEVEPG